MVSTLYSYCLVPPSDHSITSLSIFNVSPPFFLPHYSRLQITQQASLRDSEMESYLQTSKSMKPSLISLSILHSTRASCPLKVVICSRNSERSSLMPMSSSRSRIRMSGCSLFVTPLYIRESAWWCAFERERSPSHRLRSPAMPSTRDSL